MCPSTSRSGAASRNGRSKVSEALDLVWRRADAPGARDLRTPNLRLGRPGERETIVDLGLIRRTTDATALMCEDCGESSHRRGRFADARQPELPYYLCPRIGRVRHRSGGSPSVGGGLRPTGRPDTQSPRIGRKSLYAHAVADLVTRSAAAGWRLLGVISGARCLLAGWGRLAGPVSSPAAVACAGPPGPAAACRRPRSLARGRGRFGLFLKLPALTVEARSRRSSLDGRRLCSTARDRRDLRVRSPRRSACRNQSAHRKL